MQVRKPSSLRSFKTCEKTRFRELVNKCSVNISKVALFCYCFSVKIKQLKLPFPIRPILETGKIEIKFQKNRQIVPTFQTSLV